MIISRRRKILFAMIAMPLVVVLGVSLILAADLVLHHRAERSAGLNRWGYRGPVLGRKQPNEVRVAIVGGSTAFGYGVTWNESIPVMAAERLNQRHPERAWTGVNLAYNNEGAYSFLPNLRDFAYLDYDIVILYEGYNDLLGDLQPNYVTVRQNSPVFRTTGYFPILPLWLDEKALLVRGGATAGPDRAVFTPGLTDRASASAYDAAAAVATALTRQFEHAASARDPVMKTANGFGCPAPWITYCASVHRAVRFLLDRDKRVMVVRQPALPVDAVLKRHVAQQEALRVMLQREFGSDSRVAYFSAETLVDLTNIDASFDRMHLSPVGNRMVADALTEPLYQLWKTQ